MAAYRLALALLLFALTRQCDCRVATITITPQSLSLQPNQSDTGGTVTITCQASGVESGDTLIIMNIMKTVGNTVTRLVVTDADDNASLEQNTGLTGASVSGGITPGSPTSTMTLTLTQAKCDEDEGMYTCKITVLQTNPRETEDYFGHGNLSVEVSPGPVLLTPSPSGTTSWTVGETLVMTCNASVGTVDDDTEIEWVWQLRNAQNERSTLWSVYDGNDTDIEDGTMVPMQCHQRRVSILTRKLTMDDSNREYRCYIRRRQGQAGFENFDQYAGVHAVGSVSQDNTDNPGDPSGSTDNNTPTSKANTGGIIGGVIGGLVALIVIIVIIVYFVVIRPKRNKPTQYGTGVDPNKPAPYTVDPDPAPVYSQPHRNRFARDRENRGVSNRAMEDEGEKPRSYESKPARYENDFHQGRPNQAYDYDGDSRGRRYSTDDGTDNRMNTSMHSQGTGDPTIGTAI